LHLVGIFFMNWSRSTLDLLNQPTKDLRAETCPKRKLTSLGLHSHSCVNRNAWLSNRHLEL